MRAGAAQAFAAAALAAACGGETTTSPSAAAETLQLRVETSHFRVLAGTTPGTSVRAAADRLEQEYGRINTNFNLSALPVMTVRIWQDEATYVDELTRYFGVRYQAAGRAADLEVIRTNTNLSPVLRVSTPEFEAAWQAFVRQRYF